MLIKVDTPKPIIRCGNILIVKVYNMPAYLSQTLDDLDIARNISKNLKNFSKVHIFFEDHRDCTKRGDLKRIITHAIQLNFDVKKVVFHIGYLTLEENFIRTFEGSKYVFDRSTAPMYFRNGVECQYFQIKGADCARVFKYPRYYKIAIGNTHGVMIEDVVMPPDFKVGGK